MKTISYSRCVQACICGNISTNLFVWYTVAICIVVTGVSITIPVGILLTRVRNVDAVILWGDVAAQEFIKGPAISAQLQNFTWVTFLQLGSLHLSFSSGYPSMSVSFPHKYPLPAQPIPHCQEKGSSLETRHVYGVVLNVYAGSKCE